MGLFLDNSDDKNINEASSSLSTIKLDDEKKVDNYRRTQKLHNLSLDLLNETITRFRCRKCRMELFYDCHLMYHSRGFKRHSDNNFNGNWDYSNRLNLKDEDQSLKIDVLKNEIKQPDKSLMFMETEENKKDLCGKERCQIEYLLRPIKWMNLEDYQGKVT